MNLYYDDTPYVSVIEPGAAKLSGIADSFTSLTLTEHWTQPGDFSLTMPADEASIALMRVGRLILVGDYAGIIEEVQLTQGDDGADVLTASGCELSGMLSWRIALPPAGSEFAVYTGTPGEVMAAIVTDNCISSSMSARNFPQLHIGNVDTSGSSIEWSVRYESVDTILSAIAAAHGLRWRVRHDGSGMVLDIWCIANRSVNQSANVPVIYSPDYDNVGGQTYTHSVAGCYNVALAAGSGKGAERETCWAGLSSLGGMARREKYMSISKYESGLAAAAELQLDGYAPVMSLEGAILADGTYRYGKHWQLGDIVTVRHQGWGVSMDVQVSEVTRVYEGDVMRLDVTFGEGLLTLTDVLQRAMQSSDEELRR